MAIFTKYSVMLPSYVTRTGGVVYDQSQLQHKIFRNFLPKPNLMPVLVISFSESACIVQFGQVYIGPY